MRWWSPEPPGGTVNFTPAIEKLGRLLEQMLAAIGQQGEAFAKRQMKVDTGWARAHVSHRIEGNTVKFGILAFGRHPRGDGSDVVYPILHEQGIRRHLVYLRDYRTGRLRYGLVKWLERHGFTVWRKGKLAMSAVSVWGYRHPWLTNAQRELQSALPGILRRFQGGLR